MDLLKEIAKLAAGVAAGLFLHTAVMGAYEKFAPKGK